LRHTSALIPAPSDQPPRALTKSSNSKVGSKPITFNKPVATTVLISKPWQLRAHSELNTSREHRPARPILVTAYGNNSHSPTTFYQWYDESRPRGSNVYQFICSENSDGARRMTSPSGSSGLVQHVNDANIGLEMRSVNVCMTNVSLDRLTKVWFTLTHRTSNSHALIPLNLRFLPLFHHLKISPHQLRI